MQGRFAAIAALATTTLLCLAPGAQAANVDKWTQWTASPKDTWIRSLDFTATTNLVASSGDGDGIYQAAATPGPWAQTNGGLDSPADLDAYQVVASGGSLYAATGGGLFTSPGGGNWTQLGGGIGDNKLNMGGIESVVVESPTALVAAVAGAGDPGVYTTSDGGSTWMQASGMPIGENIFYLAKGAGQLIYAAGDSGVWTSVDGGTAWTLTSDGIDPAGTTFRVAVGPSPNEVWAASGSNVYNSTDGGLTWVNTDGTGDTALPGAALKAAFLLGPSLETGDVFVGTNDGVYASDDGGANWGQMSPDTTTTAGLFGQRIVYALNVGFMPPALLAGTQGFGVYSLPLTPVTASAPPTVGPTSGLGPGDSLSASANWAGTLPFFTVYTWKRCQGASCTTVGNGPDYTIPDADANSSDTYEAVACATNLLSPSPVCSTSAKTTGGVAPVPGSQLVPLSGGTTSSITPDPHISYPWGTTFTINPGQWGSEAHQNVQETPFSYSYEWQRCDSTPTCTVIAGQTGATYTTTAQDVGDDIVGYVAAQHFGGADASQQYEADETFTIIEKTPVNTVAPKVVGTPYVGLTLQSAAGAWSAHDPTYTRRWLSCGADGLDCNAVSPDQTGRTYTLTSADLGNRLELEITATQADPSQNRVSVATSAPSPVITNAPKTTTPPPPQPGPTPIPTLGKPKLAHTHSGAAVDFSLTGTGSITLTLQRVTTGHRKGKRCLSGKKKHTKACTIYTNEYTISKKGLTTGSISVPLPAKAHGKKLPKGNYRVLVTPISAAGKHGSAKPLALKLG